MKAIFRKEWHQAHLLPWAGLLLSVMAMVLYAVWLRFFVQTARDADDMASFCGGLMLVATFVMLLVSAAGLFAPETATGSLSYLLGLPISRSRVWWGKVLAGLALGISTALLLTVPASLAIPGLGAGIRFWLYLPDILCGVLLLFSVTVLCSVLFSRSLTVMLISGVGTLALLLGASAMCWKGITPLKYDRVSDLSLWALVLSPSFLLAAWLAFQRGELLDTRRHWRWALPVLVAGVAVAVSGMVGAVRWEQVYRRSDVMMFGDSLFGSGGTSMGLTVFGNEAPFSRSAQGGWMRYGEPRSQHTLLVNLNTGHETVWGKGETALLPSPDGRLVLDLEDIRMMRGWPEVYVWEAASRRRLAAIRLGPAGVQSIQGDMDSGAWSPRGDWLSLVRLEDAGGPNSTRTLVVVRPDGSSRHEVLMYRVGGKEGTQVTSDTFISSAAWDPKGDGIYLWDARKGLLRFSPAGGKSTLLWRRPGAETVVAEPWMWQDQRLTVSPDGTRAAVRVPEAPPTDQHAGRYRTVILALQSSRAELVAEFTDSRPGRFSLVWSRDSRTLFIGAAFRWREGDTALSLIPSPPVPNFAPDRAYTAAFGPGIVVLGGISTTKYLIGPTGPPVSLASLNDESQYYLRVHGVDAQGRLVLSRPNMLAALDPRTWKLQHVFGSEGR